LSYHDGYAMMSGYSPTAFKMNFSEDGLKWSTKIFTPLECVNKNIG